MGTDAEPHPQSAPLLTLVASVGAGLAALAVWVLAVGPAFTENGGISIRLPLTDTALNALCLSCVAAIVLTQTESGGPYLFCMIGSLGQANLATLSLVLPFLLIGTGLAVLKARGLSVKALARDAAKGLGAHPALISPAALLAASLLSESAVALAEPIGFVRLIVPHAARSVARANVHLSLLFAAPLRAGLVLVCDTLGRVAARPTEIPIGLVLAQIGGPAFTLILSKLLGDQGCETSRRLCPSKPRTDRPLCRPYPAASRAIWAAVQ